MIRRRFIGDSNGTMDMRGSNMFQTSRSMVFADGVPLHYLLQDDTGVQDTMTENYKLKSVMILETGKPCSTSLMEIASTAATLSIAMCEMHLALLCGVATFCRTADASTCPLPVSA